MRTFTDPSTMTIEYPENQVFSGDLNRIAITKNTTATHVEIAFTINDYLYKENLYFLTNTIVFSMAEIFRLLFIRTVNTAFDTTYTFEFTVKLYNNTSVIDTFDLEITDVILGKRRVFDEIGLIKNLDTFDYDVDLNLTDFYYNFEFSSDVYAIVSGSPEFIDNFNGISSVGLSEVVGQIDYISWLVSNYILNSSFQYLGGNNYWTTESYSGCSTTFGVVAANKLEFIMHDVSCGTALTIEYTGGTFISGNSYTLEITVDAVNNPSVEPQYIWFELGETVGFGHSGVGTFTETIICGAGNALKLTAYMDADTVGYGTHSFTATSIKVVDYETEHKIYLNKDCNGVGEKLKLRFLNRFGLWRYYYVIKKTENIGASGGVSLWFLDSNYTELNNLYSEQNKVYTQSLIVYREGVSKEVKNDISDIIYSDHIHLFDEFNNLWIPVKVQTGSLSTIDKETLFDISLNLLLQSNNE